MLRLVPALSSLLCITSADAFQPGYVLQDRHWKVEPLAKAVATGIAICSLATCPALAVAPPLEAALIQASDASYPVLKSLKPETISPLADNLVGILEKRVPAEKLTNLIDKGISVFMSIPDENLAAFVKVAGDTAGGLLPESCDLVPLPLGAATKFSGLSGVTSVDPVKLKATQERAALVLKSFPGADGKVCLPSEASLERLFVAQTDLLLSVSKETFADFGSAAAQAGKGVPLGDLTKLVPELAKTQRGVDMKARNKFEAAGKGLDMAIKRDVQFARLRGKI
mmetsp:Transcript_27318/g.54661  ORF Transcript_27318/g.54661 Transcript_27318/m.54661 type:complete len:283 (+) Transcript_27318:34-882(+)